MDRRALLKAAFAGGTLAFGGPVLAAVRPLTGAATRISDQAVRLEWEDKTRPTTIYTSADPDAPRAAMRPVRRAVRGGVSEAPGPVSPRPYYLLAGPDGELRVAERLLPLKGGRNFRDLGGYRAADGRQVRWGRLYRSGVMVGLTEGDMAYLHGLGIRVICDLRSPEERTAAPTPFLKVAGVEVLATDYRMPSTINAIGQARTREEAVEIFSGAYVGFTETLAPQYTQMFAKLVRGEAPLAVNCSAGKDRTGMASALILSALGVPREQVLADYALTEVYSPSSYFLKQAQEGDGWTKLGLPAEQAKVFAALPPQVLQVMMGSDAAVLQRALDLIDAKCGGPVQLAKARFGLTDAGVAQMRRTYLI